MDDDLTERLRARQTAPRPPALERVRNFLTYYAHDADVDLLERIVRGLMNVNRGIVVDAVRAIEEVLATPQHPGALYEMVTYEGNQMLDNETDIDAAAWLKNLAAQLRSFLGEHAPPQRES